MGFSHTELKALTVEAAEDDGRLARRTLTDRDREIQAHHMLLSLFIPMIRDYDSALKVKSSEVYNMRLKFFDWFSYVPIWDFALLTKYPIIEFSDFLAINGH